MDLKMISDCFDTLSDEVLLNIAWAKFAHIVCQIHDKNYNTINNLRQEAVLSFLYLFAAVQI